MVERIVGRVHPQTCRLPVPDLGIRDIRRADLQSRRRRSLASSCRYHHSGTVLLHLYAAAVYAQQAPHPHQNGHHHPTSSSSDPHSSSTTLPEPAAGASSSAASSSGRPGSSKASTSTTTAATRNGHTSRSAPAGDLPAPLACIYVQCQSPFPQVEEFVDECAARYHLDLTRINAGMKDALAKYKQIRETEHGSRVEAVLIGTRIGDPYAGRSICPSHPRRRPPSLPISPSVSPPHPLSRGPRWWEY